MKKHEIWLADLDPRFGTEAGKTLPVLIVQTDLLNGFHPSILVCPITSKVIPAATILRLNLAMGEGGLSENSDVLIDQIRAIDNRRLVKKLGELPMIKRGALASNLRIVLDLD